MKRRINHFLDLIGFNHQTVSHRERIITSFGGFCGILGVYFVSDALLAAQGAPVDIGGYYMPDEELATRAMRPSATFNAIIDAM